MHFFSLSTTTDLVGTHYSVTGVSFFPPSRRRGKKGFDFKLLSPNHSSCPPLSALWSSGQLQTVWALSCLLTLSFHPQFLLPWRTLGTLLPMQKWAGEHFAASHKQRRSTQMGFELGLWLPGQGVLRLNDERECFRGRQSWQRHGCKQGLGHHRRCNQWEMGQSHTESWNSGTRMRWWHLFHSLAFWGREVVCRTSGSWNI